MSARIKKRTKAEFILFLDFDGVLNSKRHFLVRKPEHYRTNQVAQFDIYNIENLEFVLENIPELKIVIESTWGYSYSLKEMKVFLRKAGMKAKYTKRIVDVTPRRMSSEKSEEIHWWLMDHPETLEWIVVDDWEIYRDPENKKKQVKTSSVHGLTILDCLAIIKHFKPDWKVPEMWL